MYPGKKKQNKTKQNKQKKSSLYTRGLVNKAIFDTYTDVRFLYHISIQPCFESFGKKEDHHYDNDECII